MAIKIEIKSTQFDERNGVSQKSGKPYSMRTQTGFAHVLDRDGKPEAYPIKCEIPLDTDQPPFQPGMYVVDDRSFMVGDYNRLAIGRLRLTPQAAGAAAQAQAK